MSYFLMWKRVCKLAVIMIRANSFVFVQLSCLLPKLPRVHCKERAENTSNFVLDGSTLV